MPPYATPSVTPIEPQPQRHVLRWIIVSVIVLIVVGAVSFFVFQLVHQAAIDNDVKTEVIKQNKLLKASAINGLYKQTLPAGVASTKKVKIVATISAAGQSYCLSGTSLADQKVVYHMNEATAEDTPQKGDCESEVSSPPTIPTDVSVASTGTADVTLRWSASLYASEYSIQCSTNAAFTDIKNSSTTSDLTKKIDNLAGSTTYYCRVAAKNKNGQSVWSPVVKAETAVYSQPPQNMQATIISSTELGYSWDAVPGAEYYMLQYTTDINFMKDVTEIRVNGTSGSVKNLQPYTGYFFRAEAVTPGFDQTHAAYSDPAFARTKKS